MKLGELRLFGVLQGLCVALYVLGFLLASRVGVEVGISVVGIAIIVQAYALWTLGDAEGRSSPVAFAFHVYAAVLAVAALIGAAALLQALGAMTGLDLLAATGDALGELFGGG